MDGSRSSRVQPAPRRAPLYERLAAPQSCGKTSRMGGAGSVGFAKACAYFVGTLALPTGFFAVAAALGVYGTLSAAVGH